MQTLLKHITLQEWRARAPDALVKPAERPRIALAPNIRHGISILDDQSSESDGIERGASTAGDHAYNVIRTLVLGGVYPTGARLKEEELTASCGVSRTPVREALRRLASEGLLELTPRHGVKVIGVDSSDLREIYDLRAMIESHAAFRAATRITPTDIEELRLLADRMVAAVDSGPVGVRNSFMRDNTRYHRIILDAADSPRLLKMASMVVELPLAILALLSSALDVREYAMNYHHELIEAFEQGEANWAAAVMKSHILSAYHGVVKNQIRLREEAQMRAITAP